MLRDQQGEIKIGEQVEDVVRRIYGRNVGNKGSVTGH